MKLYPDIDEDEINEDKINEDEIDKNDFKGVEEGE